MLARSSLTRATAVAPAALGRAPAGARNMATLREIELRLKSVRNIEKITKVYHFSVCMECALIFHVVHENDCLDEAGEGAARHDLVRLRDGEPRHKGRTNYTGTTHTRAARKMTYESTAQKRSVRAPDIVRDAMSLQTTTQLFRG